MIYYSVFFILTYLFSRTETAFGEKSIQQSRAMYVGGLILLLMGLRDQTVAGDTIAYVWDFIGNPIQFQWSGIITFFTETKEPLFYFVEYLCQQVTSSYTVYLFVTSCMVAVGFGKLLEEHSEDMFLSVLLFCGTSCMYFCMAGLRQSIAIGFTMLAYRYAKERKPIPFALLCLVAYSFHNSSIVFCFVYFIINLKPDWKMWIPVAVAALLGTTRNPIVMQIANFFTTKEYTMDEVGLNYTMFFIQLVFIVFCFVYRNLVNSNEEEENYDPLLLLSFIGLCFQALTPIKGEFFRVSYYFSVYICLIVPKVISALEEKERKIVYPIIVSGLLAYLYIFGNVRSYMTCF